MSSLWNPWHGCHKISAGCLNCYMYRGDARRGVDSTIVKQTKDFDKPVKKKRNGEYKIPPGGDVFACFTSDFFHADADEWRPQAWSMMRERSDLNFLMITKRIDRLHIGLPEDWGGGYDNVTIACTVENQDRVDYRLPIYKKSPIKHKIIICEPLLERVDLKPYDIGSWVEHVTTGGESGKDTRACDFDWIMEIHDLCVENDISFWFKQTGTNFIKDGKSYTIPRRMQHSQARKAGIDYKKYIGKR